MQRPATGTGSQLIDDEQLGLGEVTQPLLQIALGVRPHRLGDQRRGGGEQHRVAPTASRPSATAECVLRTPGGPSRSSAAAPAAPAARGGRIDAAATRWSVTNDALEVLGLAAFLAPPAKQRVYRHLLAGAQNA